MVPSHLSFGIKHQDNLKLSKGQLGKNWEKNTDTSKGGFFCWLFARNLHQSARFTLSAHPAIGLSYQHVSSLNETNSW